MEIDPIVFGAIAAFVAELIAAPIIVAVIVGRLNRFDEKREQARTERAEEKKREQDQREAERTMILAIARTMLLNNYENCIAKGYYTTDERSVFSVLYSCYKRDSGNGVIDALATRIRELPTEPPENDGDNE